MPANLENSAWPQDWKRSVFISILKKGNAKDCKNYRTIVLISHTSKVMLKILQARLQQHVNCELPDVQAGFRKGRGTRNQTGTSSIRHTAAFLHLGTLGSTWALSLGALSNTKSPQKAQKCGSTNYCTIVLISYASKVMLKILQARLQQYVNH